MDKIIYIVFGLLLSLSILAFFILTNIRVSADDTPAANTPANAGTPITSTSSATASVNVSAACTMSSSIETGDEHTATINAGVFTGDIGLTTIKAICNDNGGYAIYAIGYSNNEYGNNKLINNSDSNIFINTGTSTSGDTSSWSMKLAAIDATNNNALGNTTHTPIIDSPFNNYASVPATYTKVAHYLNSTMDPTDPTTHDDGSYLTTTYGVYPSYLQAPGTYVGKVKYALVHPNDQTMPIGMPLYDMVASMSKGKQTVADLQATIATPTQETPVSANSGVYEYDASVFGEASDASNDYPIYYYRGVLDTYEGLGEYGSDGQADAYPNYVKLGNNTCWRIVRTTGSGGIKMIYNGLYGVTESGTCANTESAARVARSPFNLSTVGEYIGLEWHNMHAVGYTYSDVPSETTTATALSTLLGSSGNDTTTNTNNSIIKQYVENYWYENHMMNYAGELEDNAGYCNDRIVYETGKLSTPLSESTEVVPYGTANMISYWYGPMVRVIFLSSYTPTLACPRGAVDIYSVDINNGGNGQLAYPVALLTADEATLIGNGGVSYAYSPNSYAMSGSRFWLLSPNYRSTDGATSAFIVGINGSVDSSYNYTADRNDVRPVVSLVHDTVIKSGSGTADDPWLIVE